ncbi:MAG: Transposase [Bacteroidota bacterium]|nr:Transposase [Bacteroidota bacterium]
MYINKIIDSRTFHEASKLLRDFFEKKGYVEVATQSRLSILSACEDPSTIATFQYSGKVWPLKQTGQMDLEYELLTNPGYPGVFCQSTSYRQEANPIPGRHDLIFPMFEFEAKGDMDDLIALESEFLESLGFPMEKHDNPELYEHLGINGHKEYVKVNYNELAGYWGVNEITANEEERIWKEVSPVLFLKNFPEHTSPFWNMKRNTEAGTSNKVDVILYGIETIGSAERENDPNEMLRRFHSISNGKYAELLYSHFGRGRVMRELGEFLDLEMAPRFGGGIGMTRMIRALALAKKMNN